MANEAELRALLAVAYEAARDELSEYRQQDDYLLAHGASLLSEESHEIFHVDALRRAVTAAVTAALAEKDRGWMPTMPLPDANTVLEKNIVMSQAEIDKIESVWGFGDFDRGIQNMAMEINRLRGEQDADIAAGMEMAAKIAEKMFTTDATTPFGRQQPWGQEQTNTARMFAEFTGSAIRSAIPQAGEFVAVRRALLARTLPHLTHTLECEKSNAPECKCDIAKLEDSITAALAEKDGCGWMPIETAPKDRNVGVLITGGFAYWEGSLSTESAHLNFIVKAYWNKDGDVYDEGGDAEFWYRPTHWQPLPPLPKGDE